MIHSMSFTQAGVQSIWARYFFLETGQVRANKRAELDLLLAKVHDYIIS